MTNDKERVSEERRTLLKQAGLLGAGAMAGLAGCAGGGGGDGNTTPTPTESPTPTGTATTPTPKPKQGGKLTYSLSDDSQKLDPHYRVTKASSQLLVNIVESLFIINEKLQPEPALVKDFSVSNDNRTYTFNLHQGVKFQPPVSREMVAKDVVANIQRIKNDKAAAAHKDLQRVESITAKDKYTVEMTLKEPFAPIITTLARDTTAILPRDYFEKMSSHPVGTGPFKFEKREKGNFVKMTQFDDHWQDPFPYVNELTSRPISDGSVRLTELKTGNVQVVGSVPSQEASKVKKNDNLLLEPLEGLAVEEFAFNNNVKPFDKPKVRKAISHAVDKKKLIKFALNGWGSTAITTLPPQSAYALEGEPLEQDFAKAKSLLKEAGHGDGFKTTLKLPASYPRSVKLGTPVQQWLKQIGVDVELKKVTWDNWISNVFGKGDFEMTTVPFYSAFNPHVALYKIFHTDATFNFFNYSNDEFDRLVEKGDVTTDPQKRKELYTQAQQIMRKDLPIFLPFYRDQLFARRKTVQNQLVWGAGEMRFWRNWLAT